MSRLPAAPVVLFALAFCASACGGPRAVQVECLWVDDGPVVSAGVATARVTLTPDDQDRFRVAVVEDTSLGTGRVWRAAVWMAAFQAAMASGQDLARWMVTVDVETGGHGIDGPSAGGLLAAAILAGMTDTRVRTDFTMTGTVNPDGTIGQVHGIPDKFRAAVKSGKTVLGHPAGQGSDRDLDRGGNIQLKDAFATDAVTVVPIADIAQAFERLTGRALDRPTPVPADQMALPATVLEAISTRTQAWLKEARAHRARYVELQLQHPDLDRMLKGAEASATIARNLLEGGNPAAAYWRAVHLSVQAEAALLIGLYLVRVPRDHERAVEVVRTAHRDADRALSAAVARLSNHSPGSPTDLMTLVDAYEALISAQRAFAKARPAYRVATAGAEARKEAISAIYDLILVRVNAQVAVHNLDFRVAGATAPVGPRRIRRLTTVLTSAANANLAYFEAGIAQPGSPILRDPDHASARAIPRVVDGALVHRLGEGSVAAALARLAGALSVYMNAAGLITRHYSIEVERDAAGGVTTIGREHAFEVMLTLAEETARRHAARAQRVTGRVPVPSRIAYDIAVAYRKRGTAPDRLEALEQFWRASLFSRLVVMLNR